MRHRRQKKKLTNSSLLRSFLTHDKIETTKTRVDQLKRTVDRAVTLAKKNTAASLSKLQSLINNPQLEEKLSSLCSTYFKDRTSGFTRRLLIGERYGDNAQLARLEWVLPIGKGKEKKKKKEKKENK